MPKPDVPPLHQKAVLAFGDADMHLLGKTEEGPHAVPSQGGLNSGMAVSLGVCTLQNRAAPEE
ncbi:hypothetical protein D3C71_2087740 [compost metagenome]